MVSQLSLVRVLELIASFGETAPKFFDTELESIAEEIESLRRAPSSSEKLLILHRIESRCENLGMLGLRDVTNSNSEFARLDGFDEILTHIENWFVDTYLDLLRFAEESIPDSWLDQYTKELAVTPCGCLPNQTRSLRTTQNCEGLQARE